MANEISNKQLDDLMSASMQVEDAPSAELNRKVKMSLYEREADLHQKTSAYSFSLWYMPMIINVLMFSLLIVAVNLTVENSYLAGLLVCVCGYAMIAGIAVTIVGVKRTNMKEHFTVHIQKRGAVA